MTIWLEEDQWFKPWWSFFTQSLQKHHTLWSKENNIKPSPLVCVTQGYNEKRVPLILVRKQPAKFWWRYAIFSVDIVVRFDSENDGEEDAVISMVRQCMTHPFHDKNTNSRALFYEQNVSTKWSDCRIKETNLRYDARVTFPSGLKEPAKDHTTKTKHEIADKKSFFNEATRTRSVSMNDDLSKAGNHLVRQHAPKESLEPKQEDFYVKR